MSRYARLSNNFYSLNLFYGKMDLNPCHDFECFFIVEHPCTEEFICDQALTLLLTGCRNFVFYGAHSKEWDIGFDLVDMQLHPDDDMNIAVTNSEENFDDFVDAIEFALSIRPFVPCDTFLIYDDDMIYQRVLERLQKYVSTT